MKRFLLPVVMALYVATAISALDFGATLSGLFKAEGNDETTASGNMVLAPWLTTPLGSADFYFSAGLNTAFEDNAILAPELFRLEFSFRPVSSLIVQMGRFAWQDPSLLVAAGRFDGAQFLYDLGAVRLGAAALYTGFLYSETADINTSPGDTKDYSADFD